MRSDSVVGYTYNADYSCPSCTIIDYVDGRLIMPDDGEIYYLDENNIPDNLHDSEGSLIGVIFTDSEWDYELICECGEDILVKVMCYCDTTLECSAKDDEHYNLITEERN